MTDNNQEKELEDYIQTLKLYAEKGIEPNGFLRAVLTNNLMDTMARADLKSQRNLFKICQYIYSKLPGNCWGSEENVRTHIHQTKLKIK